MRAPVTGSRRKLRVPPLCVAMLALTASIGGVGMPTAHAVETTTDKPVVEAPEDKALVYFFSPKRPGSRLVTYLYIDDEFVGTLRHNSFTYALVEEGRHVLWTFSTLSMKSRLFKAMSNVLGPTPWEGSEFRVVGGRTYYFGIVEPEGDRSAHAPFGEERGAERIGKIKFYATATEEESEVSAVHLAGRSSEIVEQFRDSYVEVPDHPTPEAPLDVTGLMRIDAGTEVTLELAQNLSSERDTSGNEVWFRVVEDAVAAEGVWLRGGTMVRGLLHHAHKGSSNVGGGVLDVAVPALVAVDGTVVPTRADIYEKGEQLSKESRGFWSVVRAWDIVEGGDDNIGPIGGGSAFLLLGSTAAVHTRDTVWIAPTSEEDGSGEAAPSPAKVRLRLRAHEIEFPSWLQFERVRFSASHQERPATLRVRSIAGRPPPVEIEAIKTTRATEGWLYVFDRWQILRFLPLTSGESRVAIELDGVFENGTTFVVEVPIDLKVKRALSELR